MKTPRNSYAVFVLLIITLTGFIANYLGLFAILGMQLMISRVSDLLESVNRATYDYLSMLLLPATVLVTIFSFCYILPVIRSLADLRRSTEKARRRSVRMPVILPSISALGWAVSMLIYPYFIEQKVSDVHDLVILQSLLLGAGAILSVFISQYFFLDGIFRFFLADRLFRHGGISKYAGRWQMNIRTRLWLLYISTSLIPMLALLNLIISYEYAVSNNITGQNLWPELKKYAVYTFAFGAGVALLLNTVVGRSLARPLAHMIKLAQRIKAEIYHKSTPVLSNDEIGVLGDSMNEMLKGLREKVSIMREFGGAVDPRVRDYLIQAHPSLKGELKEVTVFFIDLQNFTALSEKNGPEKTVQMLNRYFTLLSVIINRKHGHIDKFIGDAVMAVFGLFGNEKAADLAVEAALLVRRSWAIFSREMQKQNIQSEGFRIGIHTGSVLVGKIGSDDRYDYTVIGDTVNTASRVESACRDLRTDILVTEETIEKTVKDFATGRAEVIEVRGRTQPLSVYRLK